MNNFLKIYKDKKVLITGHTGFKGSWLSLWLANLGAKVVGFSLKPPTKPNLFEAINLKDKLIHVIGDIRDREQIINTCKKYKPEFIFHLAAQSLVRLSYKQPKLTYETNAIGTLNILEAIRNTKSVKVFVNVTSDKCYENKGWIYAYRENDSLGGYDPYSSSKACSELVTSSYRQSFFNPKDYNKSHQVVLSSVRAGNIIGGGDWSEDRLIPDCIRALSQNKIIVIRNPQAIRPWQYVLDPLFGYLLLGNLMHEKGTKYGEPWNFSPINQESIFVEKIVRLVIKYWGKGNYKIKPSKHFHEAALLRLDSNKALMLLGWKSLCSINEAVERTVNWYKNFHSHAGKKELYKITSREIEEYTSRIKLK